MQVNYAAAFIFGVLAAQLRIFHDLDEFFLTFYNSSINCNLFYWMHPNFRNCLTLLVTRPTLTRHLINAVTLFVAQRLARSGFSEKYIPGP